MAGRQRIVGVDVGGTFTDLVLLDAGADGTPVRLAKVPTTPSNQAEGVLAALDAAGVDPARPRPHRPRHDDDDQRRCSSASSPASGSSPRGASATCWSSAAARGRSPTA